MAYFRKLTLPARMLTRALHYAAVATLLTLLPARAAAPPPAPRIIVSTDPTAPHIPGLTWRTTEVHIERDERDRRVYAFIDGKYTGPSGTTLVIRNVAVPISADGSFRLRVPLIDTQSPMVLFAIDPTGKAAKESIIVEFPGYRELVKDDQPAPRKHAFLPSAGFSYLAYSEQDSSATASLTEIMLTLKLSYQYNLAPPRWNAGVTAFVNLVPLTASPTNIAEGESAQFLGVNVRVGYVLPQVADPWRVSVMAGTYYITMFGTDALGFRNLMGPQIFPVVRRMLSRDDSVSGYLKFSPVGSGFALRSLGDRELAAGGSWNHILAGSKRTLSIALDFANLALRLSDPEETGRGAVDVTSTSLSLSAGLSF